MTSTVEIKPTPLQLAETFWGMNCHQQAEFFGFVGACAIGEDPIHSYHSFDMQMCYVSKSERLTPNGARVMDSIGAFVEGKRKQPLL